MPSTSRYTLTALAMLAFAGNSLLCRLALRDTSIDPGSFTLVRLVAGALMLWILLRQRSRVSPKTELQHFAGNWLAALALFIYATGFSFAYIELSAATGALILFTAVQVTMISVGLARGERLLAAQWLGLLLAVAGLIYMLLPGLNAPAPKAAALMLVAGIAWGVYSLQAKSAAPLATTCGNFIRSLAFAALLGLVLFQKLLISLSTANLGLAYALASGAITSGIGYAIWYRVLPQWTATQAASIQLSAPLLAALMAVPLLNESLSLRLLLAGAAILGGIGLVIHFKAKR